ncbi:DUF3892 domain-containing protein [Ectopseudomonas toyotomiensis]|uniref:DUF3892 domain-containing protein n=1 Tax=Ectopseudomonas toyotomiensis TaxID=554344 RepID=UPI003D0B1693
MADFCITAVRYNTDRTHIEYVKVREEMPDKVGPPRTVPRAFIADLIRLGKASFITRTLGTNNNYMYGATVHVIDDIYITTDSNNRKRDNLENLPEF